MAYSRDIDGWNMVWKQDLAKLKQNLRDTGEAPPPPPKPKPKTPEVKPLADEDELFLSAMGVKRAARPALPVSQAPAAAPTTPPAPEPGFGEALKDLKGLKPLKANPVLEPAPSRTPEPPAIRPALQEPPAPAASLPPLGQEGPSPAPPAAAAVAPEPPRQSPLRIHLAAGMAVEVDGALDLRHHSVQDAEERLKDRLADAVHLGWRTLHVILGAEPGLHDALLSLISGGALPMLARYAQAPIPMGGGQAWILYLVHPEA